MISTYLRLWKGASERGGELMDEWDGVGNGWAWRSRGWFTFAIIDQRHGAALLSCERKGEMWDYSVRVYLVEELSTMISLPGVTIVRSCLTLSR